MPGRFFAVACNIDKARLYPDLVGLNWIPLKAKSVSFVNCLQVHFTELADAMKLHELLSSRNILSFKNWK